jgi:sodium-dependent dicarboxylate transporter 2/3/5
MWIKFGLPFVCIFIVLAWLWLTEVSFRGIPKTIAGAHQIIEKEYSALGLLKPGERWTLVVFVLTALAWIFENTKNIGGIVVPGLDMVIPGISDAMIAVGGALLLFILPADRHKGIFTMDWETAVRIPWGIILIFGGGLCLSAAFIKSGFTSVFMQGMSGLAGFPAILIFVMLGIAFLLLGELISNTANAAIMVPLMAVFGVAVGINPLMLMLLASLIAALGFMLPVATPPNAIAYGTGFVRGSEMIRSGSGLCLIGLVLILASMVTLVPWAMGITPEIPAWMITP